MAPRSPFPFLQKACDLATEGVMEDNKRNYQRAMQLYEEAEAYFLHALKHEAKCDKLKDAIRSKCKEFQDRVQELKQ